MPLLSSNSLEQPLSPCLPSTSSVPIHKISNTLVLNPNACFHHMRILVTTKESISRSASPIAVFTYPSDFIIMPSTFLLISCASISSAFGVLSTLGSALAEAKNTLMPSFTTLSAASAPPELW